MQRPTNAINPIGPTLRYWQYAREGEAAGTDSNVVARLQLDALSAIETGPRARPRVVRHARAQYYGIGQNDGTEGQSVRTYGCYENDWVVRMAERAAGCEIVCRATSRRRDADTVRLYRGEVLIVAKELDAGHGGVRPSVHHHLVEDVVSSVRPVSVVVFRLFAYEFLDQIATLCVTFLGAHDGGFEAQTQTNCDAALEGARQSLRILLKVELGEEAQRAQRKGENGRNDALEQP
jgi:hypothetical protein